MSHSIAQLTPAQELHLISLLNESLFLGSGSSRAVFEHPQDENLVIKLAIGKEGLNQNKLELEAFLAHGNTYLAEIHGFGSHIIIMEALVPIDEYDQNDLDMLFEYEPDLHLTKDSLVDFMSYLCVIDIDDELQKNEFLDKYWEIYANLYHEVWPVYAALCEFIGESSDNLQLGYDEDGVLKCYDYGLNQRSPDYNFMDLIGSAHDICPRIALEETQDLIMNDNDIEIPKEL